MRTSNIQIVILLLLLVGNLYSQSRRETILDGNWQIRKAGETTWHEVAVPGNFEEQIAVDFDGVAEYRTTLPKIKVNPGERVLLHFDAVATEATVHLNGQALAKHLGGWTPFRVDITQQYNRAPEVLDQLHVRVDEKVGHNTQGFLPIIAPHFGGIWQSVRLQVVPDVFVDDLKVLSVGNVGTKQIDLEFPIVRWELVKTMNASVRTRLRGSKSWSRALTKELRTMDFQQSVVRWSAPLLDQEGKPTEPKLWSTIDPKLYDVELSVSGTTKSGKTFSDTTVSRVAFRSFETRGKQLLFNGKPIVIRGLLNWGYTGKSSAPSIDEKFMQEEIDLAHDYGFNLMKFCLWMPPKRYLELCDERGMLAWVEYPAWHPKFTPEYRGELLREYDEFFYYDRNHPCVALRSLTCETGHSADLAVIRSLYERCKQRIPGAIVEDDSSWISWQRVFDFYDDHPYGNNHTWPAKLSELNAYRDKHGDKPLVLGEAIAADTWVAPSLMDSSLGDRRPFWTPWFLEANRSMLKSHGHLIRSDARDHLTEDSRHYALLMRKYQVERYRRDVPNGGYVISVIRDFPKAGMGLIDYLGNRKWKASDWKWQRGPTLIMITEDDRRSFQSGKTARFQIRLAESLAEAHVKTCEIEAVLVNDGNVEFPLRKVTLTHSNVPDRVALFESDLPTVKLPHRMTLKVKATIDDGSSQWTVSNAWPMWIVPTPKSFADQQIWVHPSFDLKDEFEDLFSPLRQQHAQPKLEQVVLTRELDTQLIEFMERGGRVFLLPNNQPGSFPLRSHWFLRGGPLLGSHQLNKQLRRQLFSELQHFDLAGDVIPDINYLDQIDPILFLWDNHDLRETRIHTLAFSTGLGKGQLFVSALKHDGETNAVGRWLLANWVLTLSKGMKSRYRLKPETVKAMKNRLTDQSIALWNLDWKFSPDPDNDGLKRNCHLANFDDKDWGTIRTDRHWEGQGYKNLDGWAWYRIRVDVPADWKGKQYLNFTGVDDYYEVYINGNKSGSGGDIEKRQTAFEDRTSHDISKWIRPGKSNTISIRVYDWYGAGGIFRPVTLSTSPLNSGPRLLK